MTPNMQCNIAPATPMTLGGMKQSNNRQNAVGFSLHQVAPSFLHVYMVHTLKIINIRITSVILYHTYNAGGVQHHILLLCHWDNSANRP
jgi:hypothetical protein